MENSKQELKQLLIEETKVLLIDDFLSEVECEFVLETCLSRRKYFQSNPLLNAEGHYEYDEEHKKSLVMVYDSEPLFSFFKAKIYSIRKALELNFEVVMDWEKVFEFQATAHNDGDFLVSHTDCSYENKINDIKTFERKLSLLYYFHKLPKRFEGGELFVWDKYRGVTSNNPLDFPSRGGTIEPLNNRLVVFESTTLHEVLPVICPSKEFADSRFALNAWIH